MAVTRHLTRLIACPSEAASGPKAARPPTLQTVTRVVRSRDFSRKTLAGDGQRESAQWPARAAGTAEVRTVPGRRLPTGRSGP